MSGKMPRFLMTSIASIVLAACGVDTMEAIPNQPDETIKLIESEEAQTIDTVEVSGAEVEDAEVPSSEADASAAAEVATKEVELAEVAISELQAKNQAQALKRLLLATHLEEEAYSFHFTETDSLDFIQIEVREIKEPDSKHALLEGAYRYILESEEILMRDYLTGDFIPYEVIE